MRLRDGGIWEIFIPGARRRARITNIPCSRAPARSSRKATPTASSRKSRPRPHPSSGSFRNYEWTDQQWMERPRRRKICCTSRSRFTKCIWNRGCAARDNESPHLPRARGQAGRIRHAHGLHAPGTAARSWSIPSPDRGAIRSPDIFAPTSRFGTPDDFRYFVDRCHQAGLGVILDWVPGHFPRDAHGLWRFDGTALLRARRSAAGRASRMGHAGFQLRPQRSTNISCCRTRCIGCANFTSTACASMPSPSHAVSRLRAQAGRMDPQSVRRPRESGSHRLPQALQRACASGAGRHDASPRNPPSWPGVSRPVYRGGLGFTMKWNMGWMHDMFEYFAKDPVFRKYHQQNITFSMLYAFTRELRAAGIARRSGAPEARRCFRKCPATNGSASPTRARSWRTCSRIPGKKLLFMGCEFGQTEEWNHDAQPALAAAAISRALQASDHGEGAELALPPRARAV